MKPVVASTVLPLGAPSIWMAPLFGIVSVFAAQAFMGYDVDGLSDHGGNDPGFGRYGHVPVRLFLMAAVIETIGMTAQQITVTVGFIYHGRPLDMLRTSINIAGDLAVSTAVAGKEFDREYSIGRLNS